MASRGVWLPAEGMPPWTLASAGGQFGKCLFRLDGVKLWRAFPRAQQRHSKGIFIVLHEMLSLWLQVLWHVHSRGSQRPKMRIPFACTQHRCRCPMDRLESLRSPELFKRGKCDVTFCPAAFHPHPRSAPF